MSINASSAKIASARTPTPAPIPASAPVLKLPRLLEDADEVCVPDAAEVVDFAALFADDDGEDAVAVAEVVVGLELEIPSAAAMSCCGVNAWNDWFVGLPQVRAPS